MTTAGWKVSVGCQKGQYVQQAERMVRRFWSASVSRNWDVAAGPYRARLAVAGLVRDEGHGVEGKLCREMQGTLQQCVEHQESGQGIACRVAAS